MLGEAPSNADPATHLAAGPWNFAGREDAFPDWENRFVFAPEPFANSDSLELVVRGAQTLCLRAMPRVVEEFWPGTYAGNEIYWQTLLSPWAIDVSRQIVDRRARVLAMLEKWGELELIVPVSRDEPEFDFRDERDFTMRGSLGGAYNFWLFSRLLKDKWPSAWSPSPEPLKIAKVEVAKVSLRQKTRRLARNLALKAPFPKLKGMTFGQSARFSLALLKARPRADHSLNLEKAFYDEEALRAQNLPEDVLTVFLKSAPASIKKASPPAKRKKARVAKTRVASPLLYEDTSYRQKLAAWRHAGGRLACVQHGGNYGLIKTSCDRAFVEYSQDAFFTWGWKKHANSEGVFIPLPYPQLAKIANKWRGKPGGRLIFVGAEMAAYGYRLESAPTPLQFVAYRRAKKDFLDSLGEILPNVDYRPYFNLSGTLSDAPWLLKRFPGLSLCEGALAPRLLDCSLLVLDHHGTTLLEALAADIPFVVYWDPRAWPLTAEGEEALNLLAACGAWWDNPRDAARKVKEIWANPAEWWRGEAARKARNYWLEHYARLPDGDINAQWTRALENL